MISKNKIEKYDKSYRIVLFQTNDKGECKPIMTVPEMARDMVDTFYEERAELWDKYKEELLSGIISPICLFFKYHNMKIKDVASRLKTSVSKVKKHLTMDGFLKLDINTLEKYAAVFDISVGDFFQFIHIDDKINVEVKKNKGRIIQDILISGKK